VHAQQVQTQLERLSLAGVGADRPARIYMGRHEAEGEDGVSG